MEARGMPRARVLVVEDDTLVREVMVEALTEAGFQVHDAEDGDEAAKLIDADGYSLVVTDINMPGKLDGIDVAAYARRKRPGIPIVFVTARPDALPKAQSSGAVTAILAKPYAPEALVHSIRSLLSASE
jgi:DNA-binding response OmpR family regulator